MARAERMEVIDRVLAPWWEPIRAELGDCVLYDAHTHLGSHDPDGYEQDPDELLAALEPVGARAVTFAMHEPDGYPPANDAVLEAAASAPDRLVAFARVDRNRAPSPRPSAASTWGRGGSSCIPAPRASRSTRRRSRTCSRSPTSAACRS